jgi:hypothetical protein
VNRGRAVNARMRVPIAAPTGSQLAKINPSGPTADRACRRPSVIEISVHC